MKMGFATLLFFLCACLLHSNDTSTEIDDEPVKDEIAPSGRDLNIEIYPHKFLDSGSPGSPGENPLVTWSSCSYELQDHPCEFNLIDQNGNEFSLYDHIGKVIVLDFSTMWCSVCKMIAPNSQIIQDMYEDQNFIYVTILIDDQTGSDPDISDSYSWSSQYGMTSSPVLVGNRSLIDRNGEDGWKVNSWPTFFIINRDMITEFYLPGWNESIIIEEIESLL